MTQPTPYTRQADFATHSATAPTTPHVGTNIDAEFNAVRTNLTGLNTNIALIQKDDGTLANGSVGADQLGASITLAVNPPSKWATGTDYSQYDTVFEGTDFYKALLAHTSGTFATDLAAAKWELLAEFDTATVADGSISAAKLAVSAVETAKIDDSAVTNAKLANMQQAHIKGRAAAAGTGAPTDLTATQVRTLINVADGATADVAASQSEAEAGTENTKFMTALRTKQAIKALAPQSFIVACSDETTALTAGTAKVTFRMPYAFTITAVKVSLSTAQTSGSVLTVDINEAGSSILSTKLTIDNAAKTSVGAATPAVINDTALAADAEMTFDIDQIGDGTAKGLKVTIVGYPT